MCGAGEWFAALPSRLHRLAVDALPWSPFVIVAALLVGALLAVVITRSRRQAVLEATWLEITPPARMPADGAVALWRALIGVVSQYGRGWLKPSRLSIEVWAAPGQLRAGVWVPGGMPTAVVAEVIRAALPGCRVIATEAPTPDRAARVTVRELLPRFGPWTPLLDLVPRLAVTRSATDTSEEPLRLVFSALARLSADRRACLQLVVSRARGGGRLLSLLGNGFSGLVRFLLDMLQEAFTSRSSSTPTVHTAGAAEPDPVADARKRAINLKRSLTPHAHVTLRVLTVGRVGKLRRETVDAVAAGYSLSITGELRDIRRWWRVRTRLAARRIGQGFMATVAELAALWHLPAEPSRYHLPDAVSRTRPGGGDLPRNIGDQGWSNLEWTDDDLFGDDLFGDGGGDHVA
ncbi:hypothetical protein AB5J62_03330 [Amycolatopsis sp. cg5]|uniref:hypothetical protein n=1 Tax=Amycolatopsis sp. cg5 TaxID=3238802 RepID=UPI0035237E1D